VQQDFAQIAQSLQANDVAGAQHAYADLVRATPAASNLASLGSALESGRVGTAQTALSKLEAGLSHNGTSADSGKITAGSIFSGLVKTGLSLLG
jgi:hypothetical protein